MEQVNIQQPFVYIPQTIKKMASYMSSWRSKSSNELLTENQKKEIFFSYSPARDIVKRNKKEEGRSQSEVFSNDAILFLVSSFVPFEDISLFCLVSFKIFCCFHHFNWVNLLIKNRWDEEIICGELCTINSEDGYIDTWEEDDLKGVFESENLVSFLLKMNESRNSLDWLQNLKIVKKRRSFSLKERRLIVKRFLEFQGMNPNKGGVAAFAKKIGLTRQVLHRWISLDHLKPGYVPPDGVVETKKRFGRVGREGSISKFQYNLFKDYIERRYQEEKQTTTVNVQDWFFKTFCRTLSAVEVSRLLNKTDITRKVLTSKPINDIDPEELKSWEEWISSLKLLLMVVLEANDEKPMRKLHLGDKTIVPKGCKRISFRNGGRSAKAMNTLSVGVFCILSFGKLVHFGKSGMGVLLKGGKGESSIPRCWTNAHEVFVKEKNRLKFHFVQQSPKGVMKSSLYKHYLEFHINRTKKAVMKKLSIDEEQYKVIPKFLVDDSAPGHSDKKESDVLKLFWEKKKQDENWVNKRIPKKSSDRKQPGDL